MKYTIKGTFITGGKWEETANNKQELVFVLNKAYENPCVISVNVFHYDENLTKKVIKSMFGEVE